MECKNIFIDDNKVLEEILNKLSNNKSNIYLLDIEDNSKMLLGNEVVHLLKAYYSSKLIHTRNG